MEKKFKVKDRLVSRIDIKDINIKKGDKGTICKNNVIEWDNGWKTKHSQDDFINFDKYVQIEDLQYKSFNRSVEISELLSFFREEKGVSQYELAKRVGVSQPMIHSVEAGKKKLSLDLLFKIMDALDITINFKTK